MNFRTSLLTLVTLFANTATGQMEFDAGRAAFSVAVNNEIYPYKEFSTFVLPQDRIVIRILDDTNSTFVIDVDTGQLESPDAKRWVWHAPRTPGRTRLNIRRESDDASISLWVLVVVPAANLRDGLLRGYQIGRYPAPIKGIPIYDRPAGFIEIRPADMELRLSPHFVLGQFVSDRSSVFPKYLVLRERLLLKLEALLERTNQRGYAAESFAILSGYRTPVMNTQMGGAEYSRHMYGGAASIIIDRDPVDGLMDDLNRDGISNWLDVQPLFVLANEMTREPANRHLQGGLALYRENARRGPYLQLDTRGVRARWKTDVDKLRFPQPNSPLTKN